jgi:hypothetical protein
MVEIFSASDTSLAGGVVPPCNCDRLIPGPVERKDRRMSKKNLTPQSRLANHQIKLSARVEASALELAARADEQIRSRLGPILEAEEAPPDFAGIQRLLARWLGHHRAHLAAVEAVYDRELRLDSRLRQRRDKLYDEVVLRLRRAQLQIDGLYGHGWSGDVIGIGTGLSIIEVARLERIAAQAIEELRRPDQAWLEPLPQETRAAIDFEALAKSIETPLLELQEVLAELPGSLKRTQGALEAKQGQIAALQKEIKRVATLLEGVYRLAELEFHAERLRPKARSAAETPEEGESEPKAAEGATVAANDETTGMKPAVAS